MAAYIRLFATALLGNLIPVQSQLYQKGYSVQPAGTNQLDILYDPQRSPVTVDLTDSSKDTTRNEIAYFIDQVSQLVSEPAQARVLDVLSRSEAMVVIGIPDDYDHTHPALWDAVGIIAQSSEGLFQVDGEGFYEGEKLILPFK